MPLTPGDRIGPYRLTSLLGQGGMGAVWRASREGVDFEQDVAIKFTREGLAPDLVDRFRRERQILAQLNHPHIARILDGGERDGTPYLVLEFIDGHRLTEYAEEHKLDLRARVILFRSICDAVQYAHQRLVVHRDLKPANILVSRDGTPKLLDFGISKILASGESEHAATQTLTGFLAMTPDYGSPEQVRGESVSTATDIYSLGAILYELLTGQRPHGLTNYDPLEVVKKICETETIPPSHRGVPSLRGDLDTIVLKAMHKDPARRYVSADQLSEDLRRYLDGLPVLARPDTISYRVSKYARRNKWGIAAVGAVMVALLIGLLIARRQASIASDRFEMVRSLANKFVFEVHDEIARVDGTTKARQLVVATGLQYLDQLGRNAGGDRALLEDLNRAYTRIGDVQGRPGAPNLGQLEAATASYQKALDVAQQLYQKDRIKYAYTLASAHAALAQNFWHRERDDDALKHLERSRALAQEAEKRDPQAPNVQDLLASNETTLGALYYGQVKIREAMREYDACEQRRQQIAARNPTPGNRLNAASAAQNLARLRQLYGDLDSARSLLERARLIVEEELAREPADPRNLRRASLLYQLLHEVNLAEVRPSLNNVEEAWNWRQKSSAITARLTAKDPANADARDLRSADDVSSGMLLSLLGRSKEATTRIEQGVALTRELKKASPNVTYFDTRESMALRWLAYAYSQLGRHDAARNAAVEAVALSERDWKSDPESAVGQLFLVSAWRMKAQVETAARDFKAAHAALDHVAGMTGKWSAAPKHELFYAVGLSNYYQSYAQLALAESKPQAEREWLDRIEALWRSWPEQNGYTKMRQAQPTLRYPW